MAVHTFYITVIDFFIITFQHTDDTSDYIFIDESFIDIDDMNYTTNIRKPSFKQLLLLAKDDWWMIALGTLSFCFIGLELSALYILMSESLKVCFVIIMISSYVTIKIL